MKRQLSHKPRPGNAPATKREPATSTDSVKALLGGAKRVRTRSRGFASWQPRDASLRLLGQVQSVLDEYAEQLPITLRQIFYQLIGVHGYDKDANAAERLGDMVNRARRARLIPMTAIRDDGGVKVAAFVRELGGSVSFTPAQISDLGLETQLKKVTDDRAFGTKTTRTCQAEAIAPDVLAQIVGEAIESRIDRKVLQRVLAREKRVRKQLIAKLSEDDAS